MAAFIRVNRNYNFTDKSPVCDELATLVDDAGLRGRKNIPKVALLAGCAPATVDGILYGITRDPRNATVMRIGIGLGYERAWRLRTGKAFNLEKELEIAKAYRKEQNALARAAAKKTRKPRKKGRKKPHLRLVSSRRAA